MGFFIAWFIVYDMVYMSKNILLLTNIKKLVIAIALVYVSVTLMFVGELIACVSTGCNRLLL